MIVNIDLSSTLELAAFIFKKTKKTAVIINIYKRTRRGNNHKLQRPRNALNQRSLRGSLTTFIEKQCFIPSFTTTLSVNIRCKFGKSHINLALLHCIPHQRFIQESHMSANSRLIHLQNSGSNLVVTKTLYSNLLRLCTDLN